MQSLDVASVTLIAGTGLAAGLVNAIAGGGSLISFPALVAAGLPAVTANITNTVALCPGYFGGAFAQRRDLVGQRSRVMMLLPTSLIGGVVGALLLLWTGEKAFDIVVPFLLLFAVALLAFQNQLQAFVIARKHGAHNEAWSGVGAGAMVPDKPWKKSPPGSEAAPPRNSAATEADQSVGVSGCEIQN